MEKEYTFKRYRDDAEFMELELKYKLKNMLHELAWVVLMTWVFVIAFKMPIVSAFLMSFLIEFDVFDSKSIINIYDIHSVGFDDENLIFLYKVLFSTITGVLAISIITNCGPSLIQGINSQTTEVLGNIMKFFLDFEVILLEIHIFIWWFNWFLDFIGFGILDTVHSYEDDDEDDLDEDEED